MRNDERAERGRVLVVAAHPDDEIIGCGALLARVRNAHVVHVTDGAPRDTSLVPAAWRRDRASYRRARRAETEAALALAGVGADRILRLDLVDQEASYHLAPLTRILADLVERLGPAVVIVHPYEGGHPDHDAAAFAARSACELLRRRGQLAPRIVEMTSYHAERGGLMTGAFLPGTARSGEIRRILPYAEREQKSRMLACFETQREVLSQFTVDAELFRPAPRYDFRGPPHDGLLYYEQLGWPLTGSRWRELAAAAESDLFGPTP